jgi:hypothetical protein
MYIKYEEVAYVAVPENGMYMDLEICMSRETLLLTIGDIEAIHLDVIDEPEMYEDGFGEFLSEVLEKLSWDDFHNKVLFRKGW